MSVANPDLAGTPRNVLQTVSLAPYLVETLCELARAVRDKTHSQSEINGLLFGRTEDGFTVVDALRTFEDTGPRSELVRRERLDKAFEAALGQAYHDPELAPFKLVGWFSLRSGSGLLGSDVDFHNRHFKNVEDLALVVWREAESQIIAELYSKADSGLLSSEEYRWSSVRLSSEMRHISEPIDLAMRVKVNEDSYLRAYQAPERVEKGGEWRKLGLSAKRTMRSLLPKRQKNEEYEATEPGAVQQGTATSGGPVENGTLAARRQSWDSGTLFRQMDREHIAMRMSAPDQQAGQDSELNTLPEPFRGPRQRPPEVSGLPMVINTQQQQRKVPWLSTAVVFLVFSGITFAVLAVAGIESGSGKLAEIMRVIFPGTDLGLHVESQGERLLLSWNRRNPVVASANDGTLQIFDGAQHREIHLDGNQVADGSVLYKPVSGDVTFRLEVHGAEQSSAIGSMRVLDATNAAANTHEGPVLDLSKPEKSDTSASPATATTAKSGPGGKDLSAKGGTRSHVTIYRSGDSGPVAIPVVPSPSAAASDNLRKASAAFPTATAAPPATDRRSIPNTAADNPPLPVTAAQQGTQQNPPQSAQQRTSENISQNPAPTPENAQPAQRTRPERAETQRPAAAATPAPSGGATINGWDANPPETQRTARSEGRPDASISTPPRSAPASSPQSSSTQTAAAPPDGSAPFIAPKPLLQVMPNTRALPQGLIGEVTRVEVEVHIDDAGRVTEAHALNQGAGSKAQLTSAALTAAKQWTFQPATLHGEKVESQHTIVFEFRPDATSRP
jgi:TonB family protein